MMSFSSPGGFSDHPVKGGPDAERVLGQKRRRRSFYLL
jgi:hypothetical protein